MSERAARDLGRTTEGLAGRALPLLALLLLAPLGCRSGGGEGEAPPGESPGDVARAAPFQQSAITFTGSAAAKPQAWTFERVDAVMRLREGRPSALEVTLEAGALAASQAPLKARLAERLAPAAHPRVSFTTSAIRETARSGEAVTYAFAGTLTLRGKAVPVSLPGVLKKTAAGLSLQVDASLPRARWTDAFGAAPDGVFDDRLDLQARLLFPTLQALPAAEGTP